MTGGTSGQEKEVAPIVSYSGTVVGIPHFPAVTSRSQEYRINTQVCAAHARAIPGPMKQFYEVLELAGYVLLSKRSPRTSRHA